MESKEELDLTMVKIVQEQSKQHQKLRRIEEQKQIEVGVKEAIYNLSDREIEELVNGFYTESIQNDSNNKKQEIHGKTYVNSNKILEDIKIIGTVAILVTFFAITSKVLTSANLISTYNNAMNKKIETELSQRQKNAYEDRHKNPITSAIEHLINIEEAKSELKETGNYNFWGKNINDSDKQYTEYTPDDIILDNLTEDAIEMATDKEIEESKKMESWGIKK